MLHTAPHRTRPLRKPKRRLCECQVKQKEDRPDERRAKAAGRAAGWRRRRHGRVSAETSNRISAAALVKKEFRRAVLARKEPATSLLTSKNVRRQHLSATFGKVQRDIHS